MDEQAFLQSFLRYIKCGLRFEDVSEQQRRKQHQRGKLQQRTTITSTFTALFLMTILGRLGRPDQG